MYESHLQGCHGLEEKYLQQKPHTLRYEINPGIFSPFSNLCPRDKHSCEDLDSILHNQVKTIFTGIKPP